LAPPARATCRPRLSKSARPRLPSVSICQIIPCLRFMSYSWAIYRWYHFQSSPISVSESQTKIIPADHSFSH
jgi:hypothetical protein